ncbi:hypothetical protein [uncultured Tateyamaria sp.]|uniref:hypothetical protein n=1 Tax=uncultured Tateyamaria sp. TaxID=455651 RepID=UPI0026050BCA|nr:hypothetical protein [uncultured Tateyamaria sp.]
MMLAAIAAGASLIFGGSIWLALAIYSLGGAVLLVGLSLLAAFLPIRSAAPTAEVRTEASRADKQAAQNTQSVDVLVEADY